MAPRKRPRNEQEDSDWLPPRKAGEQEEPSGLRRSKRGRRARQTSSSPEPEEPGSEDDGPQGASRVCSSSSPEPEEPGSEDDGPQGASRVCSGSWRLPGMDQDTSALDNYYRAFHYNSLFLTLRELLENSLDATDRVMDPHITIRIKEMGNSKSVKESYKSFKKARKEPGESIRNCYHLSCTDNGVGMKDKDIGDMLGKLYYNSKSSIREQRRGRFGVGVKMAFIYANESTSVPVSVRTSNQDTNMLYNVNIKKRDTNNAPFVRRDIEKPEDFHGKVKIDIITLGIWKENAKDIQKYLELIKLVNPRTKIDFKFTPIVKKGRNLLPLEIDFKGAEGPRAKQDESILFDPITIDMGTLISSKEHAPKERTLTTFLKEEFKFVDEDEPKKIMKKMKLDPIRTRLSDVTEAQLNNLHKMLRKVKRSESTEIKGLSPLGDYFRTEVQNYARKYASKRVVVSKRSERRQTFKGHPYVVEAVVTSAPPPPTRRKTSSSSTTMKNGLNFYRFANRRPLLRKEEVDLITEAAKKVIRGLKGCLGVFVSIVGTNIPYDSLLKEYICNCDVMKETVESCLKECIEDLEENNHEQLRLADLLATVLHPYSKSNMREGDSSAENEEAGHTPTPVHDSDSGDSVEQSVPREDSVLNQNQKSSIVDHTAQVLSKSSPLPGTRSPQNAPSRTSHAANIWSRANSKYKFGEPFLTEEELKKAGPGCLALHKLYMKAKNENEIKARFKGKHLSLLTDYFDFTVPYSDLYDLFTFDAMDISILRCFTVIMAVEASDKSISVGLLDPDILSISSLQYSKTDVVKILRDALNKHAKDYVMFFHIDGNHWILVIIIPKWGKVLYLSSLREKSIPSLLKSAIDETFNQSSCKTGNIVNLSHFEIECQQQPAEGNLCGFYACHNMTLAMEKINLLDDHPEKIDVLTTKINLKQIRERMAQFIMSQIVDTNGEFYMRKGDSSSQNEEGAEAETERAKHSSPTPVYHSGDSEDSVLNQNQKKKGESIFEGRTTEFDRQELERFKLPRFKNEVFFMFESPNKTKCTLNGEQFSEIFAPGKCIENAVMDLFCASFKMDDYGTVFDQFKYQPRVFIDTKVTRLLQGYSYNAKLLPKLDNYMVADEPLWSKVDLIFLPFFIQQRQHWWLSCLNVGKKRVDVFFLATEDLTIEEEKKEAVSRLASSLAELSPDRFSSNFKGWEWRSHHMQTGEVKNNHGIFILKYMESWDGEVLKCEINPDKEYEYRERYMYYLIKISMINAVPLPAAVQAIAQEEEEEEDVEFP